MAEKIAVTIILAGVGVMVVFYFYRMFQGKDVGCGGCCGKKPSEDKCGQQNGLGQSKKSDKSQG